ncbi:NADH:ubiquinone oxidoreductase [Fonsecaea pedrosoi]|nr:NADH:ubiquinone oxidoreductase [Fonsecaea pedrosoi]
MLHRLPSRLARPSASLLSSTTSSSRFTLARPSIRTATTAHNEHRGQDTHPSHHGDAHGHDDHFDAPAGWLWGQRPGEKYEKEGWEGFAWVFVASWVVAVAAYTMKEDTSIQTWALEEARRRLEKEGFYDDK